VNIAFSHPWALSALALALLPLLRGVAPVLSYSSLSLIPRDWISASLAWTLRSLAAIALVAMVLGLAGMHRAEVLVERIGKGAQIVVLLDRSRSMDQSFSAGRANVDPQLFQADERRREIKGVIARRLLKEFVAKRPQDMFGWVVFSTYAIRVLDFTQKSDAIQAAIEASNIGRGLSDTDIAEGLLAALGYFEDKPYTGSRIIMLVSDGGARIDHAMRQKLAYLIKRARVSVYWLYLRTYRSPGLEPEQELPDAAQDLAPEHFLHRFFGSIGTPYRAYEAEDPASLQKAIADVNRLENLPLQFSEMLPRQDLDRRCYALALALVLVLAAAKAVEIKSWR
jgi:mxaC protein